MWLYDTLILICLQFVLSQIARQFLNPVRVLLPTQHTVSCHIFLRILIYTFVHRLPQHGLILVILVRLIQEVIIKFENFGAYLGEIATCAHLLGSVSLPLITCVRFFGYRFGAGEELSGSRRKSMHPAARIVCSYIDYCLICI